MKVRQGLRPVLAAVLGATLLLGGCGIPGETDVVRVGAGRSPGTASGAETSPSRSTRQGAGDDVLAVVEGYLEAAAASDAESSLKQVTSYLSPSATTNFKVPGNIKIIHLVEAPLVNPGSDEVTLQAKTVGLLARNGIMEASPDTGLQTYKLTVSRITGSDGLFVTKAPQVLLLTDAALNKFYDQRTIYFWNRDHTALVPDVRWMSADVPNEQVPQQVINWLIDGPSAWLEDAVEPLPEGTSLVGNVPAVNDGKLQINLSNQAVGSDDEMQALDWLRRQLQWSLRLQLPEVLELKIGNQNQTDYSGKDYEQSNASARLAGTPDRFIVYNGRIRRMASSAAATEPIPIIREEDNRDVRSAAFARSVTTHQYAALVTSKNNKPVLRVGGAPLGEQAQLHDVPLSGLPSGPPVWALTSDSAQTGALGLIIVDGKLLSFSAEGKPLHQVTWPGPAGPIESVAVAPDGRRVALVVGGKLYLTAMTADGDGPELTAPRQTEIVDLSTVTAVDWGTETSVVVAGRRSNSNRVAILATEIDGTSQTELLADLGTSPVTYLTAYPVSPTTGKLIPDVTQYMTANAAFDVLAGPESINVDDLAGDTPDPPDGVRPVYPFFLR